MNVIARAALLTSANYNVKKGIYVQLNDNNMVWVMPFKSYRDLRVWYLRAMMVQKYLIRYGLDPDTPIIP